MTPRKPLARIDWAVKPFGAFRDPQVGRRGRWILFSIIIGTVSGIGAIFFDLLFRWSQALLLGGIGRFGPPGSGVEAGEAFGPEIPWLLPVSLVVGGLISGALVFGLAPEAEGHGTDAVIRSYHRKRGRIRRRVPIVKALASAITIGSGGSAGREGPIAQIGAGVGSFLADLLRLPNRDRRIMMMAGVAGGIGSIFRAPLGAALFSAEVLYSRAEFEYEVLLPGLISAITGYSIYSSYAGWGLLFDVPPISFHEPRHLLIYLALGVLCAVAGNLYPRFFYGLRDRIFAPMPVPRWLKPAVGALGVGAIAIVFPEALGMGYGYIQQAIDGSHTIRFLLAFAAVKIVATSLTVSSGGSGGVFGPSLVIGGALGAAYGQAVEAFLPMTAPEPAACVMVGMGGFFAGVAKVPFASVIMVMEMTGSYGLLVPSLLVAAVAFLFTPPRTKLYENQVEGRADSPAHLGSFAVDILRGARVRDYWSPALPKVRLLRVDDNAISLMEQASDASQNIFPVVDGDGKLAGELTIADLRRTVLEEKTEPGMTVRDVMRVPIGPLELDDDLAVAARLLAGRQADSVIVVRSRKRAEVLGTFTGRDLVVAYGRHLEKVRSRHVARGDF
jgi:CIC family chloride channel protein